MDPFWNFRNINRKILMEMFEYIRKYKIAPIIADKFPLERIGEAHLLMESNRSMGKIVVYNP